LMTKEVVLGYCIGPINDNAGETMPDCSVCSSSSAPTLHYKLDSYQLLSVRKWDSAVAWGYWCGGRCYIELINYTEDHVPSYKLFNFSACWRSKRLTGYI
jgi:hypothetical protein